MEESDSKKGQINPLSQSFLRMPSFNSHLNLIDHLDLKRS